MSKEKVSVFGLGYVGLPLSCMLADSGLNVVGIDTNEDRVSSINSGVCPLGGEEPGLVELLQGVVLKRLLASKDPNKARNCEAFFICVDTPIGTDHRPVLESNQLGDLHGWDGIGQGWIGLH